MTTNCNISETMHVGDRSTWLNSVESSCDDCKNNFYKIIFIKYFSEKYFKMMMAMLRIDDEDDVFDIFSLKIRLL
jgi:hypothetical protein